VLAPDLLGHGESATPRGDYSLGAHAAGVRDVLTALGHKRVTVVGHDRGGRVGHRMALDHPDRVSKLAVLDIIPTRQVFATVDKDLATAYYHWFFLIQPHDLPEKLIGCDPGYYLRKKLGGWGTDLKVFAPEALAEYERCFRDSETIHASCEDYRAAATIDLAHDEADLDRKVQCPLLALWGGSGAMEKLYDVLGVWREYAKDVRGRPLDAGHFLAEERPEETAEELVSFLE
jgi:haloacetate dehalogenase